MINRQLIDHIKGQIGQGVSPDAVRSSLISMGWKEKDLKEAFDSLSAPAVPPSPDDKPQLKKSHVIILVAAFLFIGLVFVFKKPYVPKEEVVTPAVIEEVAVTAPVSGVPESDTASTVEESPAMSPKDSYMKMKLESDDIKSWSDFEAYVAKYGSKERLADLASKKSQLDSLPSAVKDQLALFAKIPPSNEIVNIKESIKGNVATLNVQTIKSTYSGVVTMMLEDGRWKLSLEAWQDKAQ